VAQGAPFTSKATGNYNATGQTTWNETGTPGGNNGADEVTINSPNNVTVTAANDANADTITVNPGAILKAGATDCTAGGTVLLTGSGTARATMQFSGYSANGTVVFDNSGGVGGLGGLISGSGTESGWPYGSSIVVKDYGEINASNG